MAPSLFDRRIDYERLGGALVIGACVILAIRTARRDAHLNAMLANRELAVEVEFALGLASMVLSHATSKHAEMFHQRTAKFTEGVVEDDVQL